MVHNKAADKRQFDRACRKAVRSLAKMERAQRKTKRNWRIY